jgi:hypothetical protein
MLRRKKSRSSPQRIARTTDSEVTKLRAAIADRQEEIAQLELELSDANTELAHFEYELEYRLGALQDRFEELDTRLQEVRRLKARRAQWGDRADSMDIPDVEAQYQRTWEPREKTAEPPPEQPVEEEVKEDLRTLFRTLAKQFHPDLVTDPAEKQIRERLMAKVNQAYKANDIDALKKLLEEPVRPLPAPRMSHTEILESLREEVQRLEGVIRDLSSALQRLTNSDTVQFMLDVSVARSMGRDLINEMGLDLAERISQIELELTSLE